MVSLLDTAYLKLNRLEPQTVEIPASALEYLKSMHEDRNLRGKVVFATGFSKAIIGLGRQDQDHIAILRKAVEEVPGFPQLTDSYESNGKSLPGAIIGGAHFLVTDWQQPKILIAGNSSQFGDLGACLDLTEAAIRAAVLSLNCNPVSIGSVMLPPGFRTQSGDVPPKSR